MLYIALVLQLLAFVARTMLNREHLRYRIVAIHCILLLLLVLSRRSRAREKRAKGRRFWVRAIFRQSKDLVATIPWFRSLDLEIENGTLNL